jgi:hypothetical protein
VAILGGGLVVAEHRTAPAAIKTQSIAASSFLPTLPKFPTSPNLTTISPVLSGLQSKPQATASPSLVGSQFFFPVFEPICAGLLAERNALLLLPAGPARDALLAVNSAALAFWHCVPISGNDDDDD